MNEIRIYYIENKEKAQWVGTLSTFLSEHPSALITKLTSLTYNLETNDNSQ